MAEEPELVQVWSCQGWDLAQIYKSKLEAADIPVLLKYESAGLVYGLTVDGLGEVRLFVPAEYAADAKALLQDVPEALEEEDEESGFGEGENPSAS
jgi:hypothetical protein